ncbi:uncharacterized protein CIMG_12896 [Coccidioides immitis RS]|uniref:Uncharacterized protein n=1 Tax=Coccidioides immitis (strain RS) TaxID=246410 RepID=A0A0D8JSM7_COCIM|nr:uncharacterized protein CIMG_12896 [Coccidioides immitis RS]KJF60350.1 hypothetical protein CIMG_12896 [Coccidioides immitis RS]
MEAGKPFTAEDTKLTHATLFPHAATRTFIAYIFGHGTRIYGPAIATSRQGQSEKSNVSTPFGWFGLSNQRGEEEEEKGKEVMVDIPAACKRRKSSLWVMLYPILRTEVQVDGGDGQCSSIRTQSPICITR